MKIQSGVIWILIATLILTACAPAQAPTAPASLPTVTALSSPTLTATPLPSATPTPTATPLPTATSTPEPTIAPTPLPRLDFETNVTMQDVVEVFYQTGDFELLVNLLDALASYYKLPATSGRLYALQGDAYARLGNYERAASSYVKALDIFPLVKQVNGDLCRVYGLLGKAEQALSFCEEAARANPNYLTYLNRGKVYAALGNYYAAAQDFQMAAELLKLSTGANEKMLVQELVGWIETLKTGKNPITPQMLAEERQVEMASALPTQTAEEKAAPSSKTIQEAAAQFGFSAFTPTDIKDPFQENSLPFIAASLNLGACTADLALQADDNMIYKIMMTMRGCSYLEEYALGLRLIDRFFPDKSEKAEALIWMFKEANSVIEVENAEAKIVTVRKCNLSATYNRTDKSTVLLFSCH